MSRRLYLGRLPADTRSEDVNKLFDGYGRIVDCRVMTGFGFVEFEDAKDAEDALHNFNGKPFMGVNIVVEFAKESRPRREVTAPRARRPPGIRIIVSGISRDTSWQDLKDFGRDAGSVSFADIDRDVPGQGILEYLSRDDADRAVRDLDNKDLRGKVVRVSLDDSSRRGGDDYYRRDDRRDDRDRYRDERPREDRYRRERSRSPRREEARRRSPPPRREADDRRPADDYRRGYDERRPAEDPYSDRERRRDDPDRKRDDRRRDDRDDRYDDRAARPAPSGEAWAR